MKYLHFLFVLLLVGVAQGQAQQVIVHAADGETKFEELDYASCKITFSDGQMQFHVGDEVKSTFAIKDVQRISFYGLQSGIEVMPNEAILAYSPVAESLIARVHPGTPVVVYRIDGTRVLSHVQTIASSPICVEHLPAGVYIAAVGSETLKFVKP